MTTPSWASKPTRLAVASSPIHALTFSSGSGQYILTGSADRSITLWNPASGRKIQSYAGHGYEILDLCVSADNSKFVSVGGDKTVFVWDVATAQTVRRFNGHSGRVNGCSFGGEGESVCVTGSFDGTVRVWDLKSRNDRAVMIFSEAKDAVSCVDVHGECILAGSVDGRVRGYDLRTGMVVEDCVGEAVNSVCATKDGQAYLAGTLDSKLRLMDRSSGGCLQTFGDVGMVNENYRIRSSLVLGDSLAVSGSENGQVLCWDVGSGELKHRLWHGQKGGSGVATKKDVVSAVAWNPARKQLASADGDGVVTVWDMG